MDGVGTPGPAAAARVAAVGRRLGQLAADRVALVVLGAGRAVLPARCVVAGALLLVSLALAAGRAVVRRAVESWGGEA